MRTSPTISGMTATGSRNRWVSSSEAPQNAATEPVAARPMASPSLGALGSAGGASWKVSSDISRPAAAIPATIQNSGRHA